MDLKELLKQSIRMLTLNKMRTGLASLGIVIGIGSVIALMSLGQASQAAITSQIQSLGSNLLTVQPGSVSQGGVMGGAGGRTTLTLANAKAMKTSSDITTIKTISPEITKQSQVTTGESNTNTRIIGATPEYTTVHNISIESGNFITEDDVNSMTKVAVIGPTTATTLFGEGVDPLGQTLRISGQTFTIIGVTTSKGGSGFMNQDDVIYIPLLTAQKIVFGMNYLSSIALEVKSAEEMVAAQDEVGYFLLKQHGIEDPTKADFSIMSQQDILNTASSMTGTFTALLSGIAAISLLVGGIGIMNIMLVTVTERTREIGLRKALGAKKKTITTQFIVESIILTFTGGIIGIIVGIITSFGLAKALSMAFIVSPSAILLAFVVSVAIGILFGWYPARKASEMQPIEALRYE